MSVCHIYTWGMPSSKLCDLFEYAITDVSLTMRVSTCDARFDQARRWHQTRRRPKTPVSTARAGPASTPSPWRGQFFISHQYMMCGRRARPYHMIAALSFTKIGSFAHAGATAAGTQIKYEVGYTLRRVPIKRNRPLLLVRFGACLCACARAAERCSWRSS